MEKREPTSLSPAKFKLHTGQMMVLDKMSDKHRERVWPGFAAWRSEFWAAAGWEHEWVYAEDLADAQVTFDFLPYLNEEEIRRLDEMTAEGVRFVPSIRRRARSKPAMSSRPHPHPHATGASPRGRVPLG